MSAAASGAIHGKEVLTVDSIRRIAAGNAQAFLWDAGCPGLAIRVTVTGNKAFIFQTKLFGKTIRRTIGSVKVWDIEGARAEAHRLRAMIHRGTDPRDEKAEHKAAAKAKKAVMRRPARVKAIDEWWIRPRGRVCPVDVCPRCKRYVYDTQRVGAAIRAKWGAILSTPPRTNGSWLNESRLCGECSRVRCCDLCGKEGTTSNIYSRTDVWAWNDPRRFSRKCAGADWVQKNVLCMGCWNKVRAISRKEEEAEENRRFLNKLERVISNERKNQNHRRAEGLPCQHDARREERRPGIG